MHLSEKLKTFCSCFCPFLKPVSNFKPFAKKDDSHSLCISEITDCERDGYTNVYIGQFQSTLRQPTCHSVPSTDEIWMTSFLTYFLMTLT